MDVMLRGSVMPIIVLCNCGKFILTFLARESCHNGKNDVYLWH